MFCYEFVHISSYKQVYTSVGVLLSFKKEEGKGKGMLVLKEKGELCGLCCAGCHFGKH
jgi:hypothetical protein